MTKVMPCLFLSENRALRRPDHASSIPRPMARAGKPHKQTGIDFARIFSHPPRQEIDLSNHQINHEAAHVHSLSHVFDRFAWRMPDAGGTGTTNKPTPLRRHPQTKSKDDRPKPENDASTEPVRHFTRSSAFAAAQNRVNAQLLPTSNQDAARIRFLLSNPASPA